METSHGDKRWHEYALVLSHFLWLFNLSINFLVDCQHLSKLTSHEIHFQISIRSTLGARPRLLVAADGTPGARQRGNNGTE